MSYQICPGTPEDRAEIHARLQAYNARYITDCAEFSLCVRDERGELLGGLAATRDLDCVTVDYLFVAEGPGGRAWGPPCWTGPRMRPAAGGPGGCC